MCSNQREGAGLKLAKTKKGRAVHVISHPYPGLDSAYEKMFNSARKNGWLNVALCGECVQDPMPNPPEGPTCKDCIARLADPEYKMTPDERRTVRYLERLAKRTDVISEAAAKKYARLAQDIREGRLREEVEDFSYAWDGDDWDEE